MQVHAGKDILFREVSSYQGRGVPLISLIYTSQCIVELNDQCHNCRRVRELL